jgi:alkylation response protein AidB-like acyl-CoA dehydrogenase
MRRDSPASGWCPQFTEDHEAFRQLARDFVEKEIGPHYDDWEKAGQMPQRSDEGDHRQVTRFVTGGEKILL